jgi:hypothetical protein
VNYENIVIVEVVLLVLASASLQNFKYIDHQIFIIFWLSTFVINSTKKSVSKETKAKNIFEFVYTRILIIIQYNPTELYT